jgi:hypothetical protein
MGIIPLINRDVNEHCPEDSWTNPTTQPEHTEPPTDDPEMAPFSRVGAYNLATTQKAVICQFRKNTHLISHLTKLIYKKVKMCARIQWTMWMALFAPYADIYLL